MEDTDRMGGLLLLYVLPFTGDVEERSLDCVGLFICRCAGWKTGEGLCMGSVLSVMSVVVGGFVTFLVVDRFSAANDN